MVCLPLIQLKFDDMNGKVSYEWLYRGNFRLLPIYEETQRRKVRVGCVVVHVFHQGSVLTTMEPLFEDLLNNGLSIDYLPTVDSI